MKQRIIPANADETLYDHAKLAVYTYPYMSRRGREQFAARIYKGRQSKAKWFYGFATDKARADFIERIVADETRNENFREARKKASHGLQVGDVLYRTWGYDQTNVDFYQVNRVPSSRSVAVVPLAKITTPDGHLAMSGRAVPNLLRNNDEAPDQIRRTIGHEQVTGGDGGSLQKWNGTPVSISWYA